MKLVARLMTIAAVAIMAACGGSGGGGSTPPAPGAKTSTIKLATTGTPSAQLAGIGVTVTLPAGVTPSLNTSGKVVASVVTVSGAAAPGTAVTPGYNAATRTLQIVVASNSVPGFGSGEFATLTLDVAAGVTLKNSDFSLTAFTPVTLTGGTASGLTPGISSVTVQ